MLTVIEKVLLLQELDFFRFAYTEHISQVAQISKEVRVSPGTILFRQAEQSPLFNLIVTGQVTLERDGQIIEEVSRGAVDWWPFFAEQPHHVTARAVEDCHLLTISFEDMVDLLTAEPEFCWAITKQLAHFGNDLIRTFHETPKPE